LNPFVTYQLAVVKFLYRASWGSIVSEGNAALSSEQVSDALRLVVEATLQLVANKTTKTRLKVFHMTNPGSR
jgi:hypothetical protein